MADDFDVLEYDSDQYRISFSGVTLSKGAGATGYADGVFLKITMAKKSFESVEGTDGTLVFSKTNSRLFTAELSFLQCASNNDFLSSMLASDEQSPNGAGVGTLVVEDLQGTTLFKSLKCRVEGWPEQEFDRTAKDRKWSLTGARSKLNVGSN